MIESGYDDFVFRHLHGADGSRQDAAGSGRLPRKGGDYRAAQLEFQALNARWAMACRSADEQVLHIDPDLSSHVTRLLDDVTLQAQLGAGRRGPDAERCRFAAQSHEVAPALRHIIAKRRAILWVLPRRERHGLSMNRGSLSGGGGDSYVNLRVTVDGDASPKTIPQRGATTRA